MIFGIKFNNNMMKNMKHIHFLLLTLLLVFSACENSDDEFTLDESALIALLDADDAAGLDGFDDEGLADLDFEFGLETEGVARFFGDTLSYGEGYRIRFGRLFTDRDRTVEFTVDGDTAIGFVTHTITGVLMVQAIDTSNHEAIDSMGFSKDFTTVLTRQVRYVQEDDVTNPNGYRWKIDALTPLIGGAGEKVSITNVDISTLSVYGVGNILHSFNAEEVGTLFIDRESLPTFNAFELVLIQMSVENDGPEYTMDSTGVGEWCTVHYARNRQQRGRRFINDTGRFFDTVMNDNIHSGAWLIHGPGLGQNSRVFRSFYDVIDLATIFTEDGGYNTAVWSIPYRVERP